MSSAFILDLDEAFEDFDRRFSVQLIDVGELATSAIMLDLDEAFEQIYSVVIDVGEVAYVFLGSSVATPCSWCPGLIRQNRTLKYGTPDSDISVREKNESFVFCFAGLDKILIAHINQLRLRRQLV
jgi:hypothetical protein